MLDYTRFQDVFPADLQIPYDRRLQHEIDDRRKSLDGTLFIDRVMKALGIAKAKTYPPKSESALRQVHQQICDAGMSMHHKQSLLYYILLDFDGASGRDAVSEAFAMGTGMPGTYQVFMKGLWYMDRQDYQRALEYVAHPSLTPDFADDIVVALVRHAEANDYSLALAYYHTVRPILKTSEALELLFDAMVRTDATEALLFSRTHPGHTREQLFRRWMGGVLDAGKGDKAAHVTQLALMPFDATEEAWFEEYLTRGEGRNLRRAKDTLLMRMIACDRFADVSRVKGGGPWSGVIDGIRKGIEGLE
ncbi:hypothetical protein JDV02_003896 [Purpureocillium takamizusanense]|uniref:ELYS-like domain-containing protein n=1 Tax=Purpureocillium takamizusanense TaxID=2060973 RepID=A0A9Q8QER3_9HYPO|nr:uncharacterized protein JDV02_003896 [Purpureocillium takamizusanense]UNI17566.1 hypothetical protein JDV02_003896 [Purpureocillium takamizusanense]